MNKKIIIANWKMNPNTLEKAVEMFNIENCKTNNTDVIICPPFLYLYKLANPQLQDNIVYVKVGAQTCHFSNKGTYTGKISPDMLKQAGCQYVLLGHSELRESDEIVNKKIRLCAQSGLTPIVCIAKQSQIMPRLANLGNNITKLIIAYEPIHAIGTGKPESIDNVLGTKLLIQRLLINSYSRNKVEKIRIIYGGSVNAKTALNYITEARMDGLLIGTASLDPNQFLDIVKLVDNGPFV